MRLADLRREIDWQLQNRLTWSAPVLRRTLRDPQALVAGFSPAQAARYHELASRYSLARWPQVCNARDWLLNLHVLDVLDRTLATPLPGRSLDIGAGRWGYLPALHGWSGGDWDGIELDPHRRDWALVTRRGYAEHMRRLCPGCRYMPGSIMATRGAYPVLTWFLPYVLAPAFAAAGLPRRFYSPRELLAHACSRIAPGGQLLIINQGEREAAAQQQLLAEAGIAAQALGRIDSVFPAYRQPRYGWRVTS